MTVPNQEQQPPIETPEQKESEFVKLKKEKENYKSAKLEAEKKLEEANKLLAEIQEQKLIAEKNDKALTELYKKERDDFKNELNGIKEQNINSKKLSSLEVELIKNGADVVSVKSLLKLADVSKIKIDDETGTVYGIDDQVKILKASMPIVFTAKKGQGNHESPEVNKSPIDLESYSKMNVKQLKSVSLADAWKIAGFETEKKN
jgi:hypothetical protein